MSPRQVAANPQAMPTNFSFESAIRLLPTSTIAIYTAHLLSAFVDKQN